MQNILVLNFEDLAFSFCPNSALSLSTTKKLKDMVSVRI